MKTISQRLATLLAAGFRAAIKISELTAKNAEIAKKRILNFTISLRSLRSLWLILIASLSVQLSLHAAEGASVLIEAESFAQFGGWVLDPQFMDQMGSPYLLAHGLGRPVADAATSVRFPAAGIYRVFVRTKDWVARWQAPGAPGRFQLLLDGQRMAATFGAEGADWHWQAGGTVQIPDRQVTLALHDLTGFEGRCDAILFTTDEALVPPAAVPELAAFRRKLLGAGQTLEPASEFDFVVVGGGMAGTCAAIAAARLGLKVALVQDRPVLGGNNSSEVRVWLQGARNKEPWPRIGDVVGELEPARRAHYGPANTAELYEDEKKLAVARAEPGLRLFLEHRANGIETHGNRIVAVLAENTRTGGRARLGARCFADTTGDGALGHLAGADFDLTPKGHMGPCNLWNVSETPQPQAFPRCPWALDLSRRPFPGRGKTQPDINQLGGWYWESGFDHDPIRDAELIRDWNFRAMYGAWDAMKNVDGVLPNHQLNWAAHILGRRESRRLLGDLVLTKEDLEAGRQYPDGCVPTGWKMDLHLPDPRYEKGFEGDAFISKADFGPYPMPYWIPYRCLYSRNVTNLFMAGRDISVTHEALGAVRVMRTGGCMGEVVGMAASLCVKHQVAPRAIFERYLRELQALMRQGVGKNPGANPSYINQGEPPTQPAASKALKSLTPPPWLDGSVTNHARTARVSVSTSRDAAKLPPSLLNDGRLDLGDNNRRWLSASQPPHVLEFAWDQPLKLNAARIISGYRRPDGLVDSPLGDFQLEYLEGALWRSIPGAAVQANDRVDWSVQFPTLAAGRVRLRVTAAPLGIARLWEVELYGPADKP
jgi:hypothetical protein